jgi:membrane-associated phospholipid phosphatase
MAESTAQKPIEKLQKQAERQEGVVEKANPVAPPVVTRPVRRYRALIFQGYVVAATVAFAILFFFARTVAYFTFDLTIERALQSIKLDGFDLLMQLVSGLGFNPIVWILCTLIVLYLFIIGLRWEAVMAVFAAGGVSLLGAVVKLVVHRVRPTADLVNVFSKLNDYSFPSGHVLLFTAFLGFFWFMIYTLSPKGWGRTLGLFFFGALVALVGVSRVYLGQHWPSDVVGAYLLGSLWLALTIYVYRWGKPRFFVDQPVAPEVPKTGAATTTTS